MMTKRENRELNSLAAREQRAAKGSAVGKPYTTKGGRKRGKIKMLEARIRRLERAYEI